MWERCKYTGCFKKVLVYMIFYGILWHRQWRPPSIRIFFPPMLICLQKCVSNHDTKQASKFQSDLSTNCFTIIVWKMLNSTVYFLLSYCVFLYLVLHKFCSVLTCDILGIGLLYNTIICSSVKMNKSHNIPFKFQGRFWTLPSKPNDINSAHANRS